MVYELIVYQGNKKLVTMDCKSRQEAVDLKILLNKELPEYVVLIIRTVRR